MAIGANMSELGCNRVRLGATDTDGMGWCNTQDGVQHTEMGYRVLVATGRYVGQLQQMGYDTTDRVGCNRWDRIEGATIGWVSNIATAG